jgi:hypothetical protein
MSENERKGKRFVTPFWVTLISQRTSNMGAQATVQFFPFIHEQFSSLRNPFMRRTLDNDSEPLNTN